MKSSYIGPHGKFAYDNTPMEWFDELYEGIHKMLDRPTVYMRKKWNERIYDKWYEIYTQFIEMAKHESGKGLDGPVTWYHNQCLDSIVLFGLSYIITDNGFPMFMAPWQYDFMLKSDTYKDIAGLMSRKLGKSEIMKALVLKKMITPKLRGIQHVRMFAPRERQLFLRDRINRMLRRSRFFQEEYIMEKNENKYSRGRFSDTYLEFGRNGSTMVGAGLAITSSGGRSATGEAGTFFAVDEFGQIDKKAIDIAIIPMLLDAYSDKQLVRLGTPTRDINTDIRGYWQSLKDDPEHVYTFSHDWVYGVRTGCIPKEAMKKVARDKQIYCPFMRKWGMCGKEQLGEEVRINRDTGKLIYSIDEDYDLAWKCNMVCREDDSFIEEYCADFGVGSQDFFNMDLIRSSGDQSLDFIHRPPVDYKPRYDLSVDFGHLTYPTQAILAEKLDGRMIKRKVVEIKPKIETKSSSAEKRYARPILGKIYEEFGVFEKFIDNYYFDITGDKYGYLSADLVDGFDGFPGFEKKKIYRNEVVIGMKEKQNVDLYGLWVDGPWNSERKKDLRLGFNMGIIVNPMVQPFWDNYLWEFENCKPALTQNEQYWTFKEPKHGRKRIDLLDADSFLTLDMEFNRRQKRNKTYYGIAGFSKVENNNKLGGGYRAFHS